MQIAIEYPALAYDGSLTFSGMLRKYFVEKDEAGKNVGISKRWNDKTKGTYIRQYEKKLIPILAELFGKEMPLHMYSEENFEEVISTLEKRHHYAEATLQHYRHLLWVVYKAGFEHEHYVDNIFWVDVIDLEEGEEDEREDLRIKVMTRTRRSFSVEEELRIVEWFLSLDPEMATGEEVGLLFMFFEGLRNNEACGANLGSVRVLQRGCHTPVFDMVQTTEIGSNVIKGSGKTGNAPRRLPLLSCFYDFLKKRITFLEKMVSEGKILLSDDIDSVEKIPFVCREKNYLLRASTTDLTKAGRALFERIGIDKRTIAVLHQVLCSEEFKDLQIGEKEPTTYLFRRNFATHLHLLGFSLDEIQYLIGHEVESLYVERNSFVDDETIRGIWSRLEQHPVNKFILDTASDSILDRTLGMNEISNSATEQLAFESCGEKDMMYDILLDALEPRQAIELAVEGLDNAQFDVMIRTSEPPVEYPRTATILDEHYLAYQRLKRNRQ